MDPETNQVLCALSVGESRVPSFDPAQMVEGMLPDCPHAIADTQEWSRATALASC